MPRYLIFVIFFCCFCLQLDQLKHRLTRVQECIGDEMLHLLPTEDGINIDKLGQLGTITTDTCNNAQKQRQLLSQNIKGEVIEQDCHRHLRNVWAKAIEIDFSKYLTVMLRDSLDKIDSSLCVSTMFTPFARAYDKESSLSTNYPKGHGELFAEWMKENYPGKLLFHVESTNGSCQDIMFTAALAIAMNRSFNIEFLNYCLRMSDKKKKDHVLQRSLFVVLSSVEMAAQARLLAIMYLSIILSLQWLAGNTHKLASFHWGARSMGCTLDVLREKFLKIKAYPNLILDEYFMMTIFDQFLYLTPFTEYLDFMFTKRRMSVIARRSGAKVMHIQLAWSELFNPTNATNIDTTTRVVELGTVAMVTLLREFYDPKKASHKYFSVSKSEFSCEYCPEHIKRATLGIMAVNNVAESSLGGCTRNVQTGNQIHLSSAAAISDAKRNHLFDRSI
jgi:hypothetical protein